VAAAAADNFSWFGGTPSVFFQWTIPAGSVSASRWFYPLPAELICLVKSLEITEIAPVLFVT